MGTKRVFEIARELGYQNRDLIDKLQKLGFEVKSHASLVDEEEVRRALKKADEERRAQTQASRVSRGVLRRRPIEEMGQEVRSPPDVKAFRGESEIASPFFGARTDKEHNRMAPASPAAPTVIRRVARPVPSSATEAKSPTPSAAVQSADTPPPEETLSRAPVPPAEVELRPPVNTGPPRPESAPRARVFISYAHEDEQFRRALEAHLSPLEVEGVIELWHDRDLTAGSEWKTEITQRLKRADVILLLISAYFVESYYCREIEMREALEHRKKALVIPIFVRAVEWQSPELSALQALPKDARPVASWPDQDAAWSEVVRGIRIAIAARNPSALPAPPQPGSSHVASITAALDDLRRKLAVARLHGDEKAAETIRSQIESKKREMRRGPQLKAGEELCDGRLRLIAQIGRGAFSTVWKAYDFELHREVAVKVLHSAVADVESSLERFRRGAREMARLNHRNILRMLQGVSEEDGFHFFVAEYMAGGDLHHAVSSNRISLGRRIQVIVEICEGLEFAHQNGVLHRDIKPSNILLHADGTSRLTDFDLARVLESSAGTRTNTSVGTLIYAAPEAIRDGATVDARADVFSLGMTLLFVLHGREFRFHPYALLQERQRIIDSLNCDNELRAAIVQAIAMEPEERSPSIEHLRKALLSSPSVLELLAATAREERDPSAAVRWLRTRAELSGQDSLRTGRVEIEAADIYAEMGARQQAKRSLWAAFEVGIIDDGLISRFRTLGDGAGDDRALLELLSTRYELTEGPARASIALQIAHILENIEGREEEGALWCRRALEADPTSVDVLAFLSELAGKSERWVEFALAADKLIEIAGSDGQAALRRQLAVVYADRLGDPARAVALLRGLLEEGAGDVEAARELARLEHVQLCWSGVIDGLLFEAERMSADKRSKLRQAMDIAERYCPGDEQHTRASTLVNANDPHDFRAQFHLSRSGLQWTIDSAPPVQLRAKDPTVSADLWSIQRYAVAHEHALRASELGHREKALAIFSQVAKGTSGHVPSLRAALELYVEEKRWVEAQETALQLLQCIVSLRGPSEAEQKIWSTLFEIGWQAGDLDVAAACVSSEPRTTPGWNERKRRLALVTLMRLLIGARSAAEWARTVLNRVLPEGATDDHRLCRLADALAERGMIHESTFVHIAHHHPRACRGISAVARLWDLELHLVRPLDPIYEYETLRVSIDPALYESFRQKFDAVFGQTRERQVYALVGEAVSERDHGKKRWRVIIRSIDNASEIDSGASASATRKKATAHLMSTADGVSVRGAVGFCEIVTDILPLLAPDRVLDGELEHSWSVALVIEAKTGTAVLYSREEANGRVRAVARTIVPFR